MKSKRRKSNKSICAICGAIKRDTLLYKRNFSFKKHLNTKIFSARRLPDKVHGTIVRCKKCELVRSLEIIDKKTLAQLYKESSFTYDELTNNLRETYRKLIEDAGEYVANRDSFLEIGCGNGFMLEEAKKLGYKKVAGVEPSENAISLASKSVREKIVCDVLKSNTFQKESFDLICAFQVFDHIPNPDSFLKICRKLLKPGGVLLLMNHDVRSLSAKVLGERSPIIDIEHTYLYDQSTIRKILIKNKFDVERVYSPQAMMTIRYILRLLPLPTDLKKIVSNSKLQVLDKTVKIYPGNLCAIAIKK